VALVRSSSESTSIIPFDIGLRPGHLLAAALLLQPFFITAQEGGEKVEEVPRLQPGAAEDREAAAPPVVPPAPVSEPKPKKRETRLSKIYSEASPSVVKVRTESEESERKAMGFVISGDGLIATVFGEGRPTEIFVAQGGKERPAKIIAYDDRTRLAFIRAEGVTATPLTLAVDDDLVLAQFVAAVTARFSPQPRAIPGRLAGREKHFRGNLLSVSLMRVNMTPTEGEDIFGAPVLREDGKVVGVALLAIPDEASSLYVLPAENLHKAWKDVTETGSIGNGWIGITLEEGTTTPKILESRKGGPADLAGLKPGDVILRLGDRAIREYQDVADASYFLTPGKETTVEYLRGLTVLVSKITPQQRPSTKTDGDGETAETAPEKAAAAKADQPAATGDGSSSSP